MSTAALGSESGHHSLNSELRVLWGQFQAGGAVCLLAWGDRSGLWETGKLTQSPHRSRHSGDRAREDP